MSEHCCSPELLDIEWPVESHQQQMHRLRKYLDDINVDPKSIDEIMMLANMGGVVETHYPDPFQGGILRVTLTKNYRL